MSTWNHLQSDRTQRGWHCGWLLVLLLFVVLPNTFLSASEIQIAAGQSHTLVLTPDGRVWAFGDDSSGQLGDDTLQADKPNGVLVSGLTNVIAIAAGREHSLALCADGTVWAWGANNAKQLGSISDNAATFKTTPQQLGLSYIVSIAAGGDHSLAIERSGLVYAWGSDSEGQLGNGATTGNQVSPQTVQQVGGGGSLAKALAVAAGASHSMALLADGTVVTWGRDDEGQLGNGGTLVTNSDSAVPVSAGIADAVAIACGDNHSLVRLADGTVRGWGRNDLGQLGTLPNTNQASPVTLTLSPLVKQLSAGANHSVFLLADGSLRTTGNDAQGALGNDGSFSSAGTPVTVSLGGTQVRTMVAGGNHTIAMLANGSFRAWGADNQMQLGNGSGITGNQALPSVVDVTWPMVGITAVEAGQRHNVALQADGSV